MSHEEFFGFHIVADDTLDPDLLIMKPGKLVHVSKDQIQQETLLRRIAELEDLVSELSVDMDRVLFWRRWCKGFPQRLFTKWRKIF